METATEYQTMPIDENFEMPSFEESNGSWELIDEGVYQLELKDVTDLAPVLAKFDPTGKKMRAKFTFEVVEDEDYEGYTLNAWYNITMNEKSALYPVAKALMGGVVDPAQKIKPSMLKGKRMNATVVHGDPDGNGSIWPKITSPLAIKARKTKGKTALDVAIETFDADAEVPF